MPAPVTPVAQGTPELTAQGSITADTARARICSFIGPDGEGVLVSADDPLPTTGGGGGGGDATAANQVLEIAQLEDINTNTAASLTDTQLRATPVPVSATSLDTIAGAVGEDGQPFPPGVVVIGGVDGANAYALNVTAGGAIYAEQSSFPWYTQLQSASAGATTTFDSVVAAPLLAASFTRRSALIYLPDTETASMHILWGAGTVSAALRSYTLLPGAAYVVPPEIAGVAMTAILTEPGTAFVTEFT